MLCVSIYIPWELSTELWERLTRYLGYRLGVGSGLPLRQERYSLGDDDCCECDFPGRVLVLALVEGALDAAQIPFVQVLTADPRLLSERGNLVPGYDLVAVLESRVADLEHRVIVRFTVALYLFELWLLTEPSDNDYPVVRFHA